MAKVLLVDDDLTMLQMVAELLRQEGHEVFPFSNGSAALAALTTHAPELVITDLYFDKTRAHGLEVVQKARALSPPAVVIVITGYGTIETAVEAMKNGAFDYLEKPFKVDDLKLVVQRALSYNAVVSETVYLRKQLKKKYEFSQIIGNAPSMQAVFKMIERVANTDSTILVLGESGTGKELVARALHFNSRRQFAPFVPVNCSALPENLLESELFGHRRGSFTGAISDKKGLFEEADGGTIFLDEVGSMSAMLQSRLLRVLQERTVMRLGSDRVTTVDVRVIAATNKNLRELVRAGRFRDDLFYRLDVLSVRIPPLRERPGDVLLLARKFLRHYAGNRRIEFSPSAEALLARWTWPGNVRELRNVVERASVLARTDVVGPEHLGLSPKPAPVAAQVSQPLTAAESQDGLLALTPVSLDLSFREAKQRIVDEFERRFILHHLERSDNVLVRAAQTLDMHRQTLQQKLRDLGIQRPDSE